MADAPLQPATMPLQVGEIYEAFIRLCVDTHGAFEAACAAAAVRGFEPYDGEFPIRRDAARLVAEARFRKTGFFFTAASFLTEQAGRPTRRLQDCTLLARPASYEEVAAALTADMGSPTSLTALPGVEFAFIGDPTSTQRLSSRSDGFERFERGEGDLVLIRAWEVREQPGKPGDAVALSYQRSSW